MGLFNGHLHHVREAVEHMQLAVSEIDLVRGAPGTTIHEHADLSRVTHEIKWAINVALHYISQKEKQELDESSIRRALLRLRRMWQTYGVPRLRSGKTAAVTVQESKLQAEEPNVFRT